MLTVDGKVESTVVMLEIWKVGVKAVMRVVYWVELWVLSMVVCSVAYWAADWVVLSDSSKVAPTELPTVAE